MKRNSNSYAPGKERIYIPQAYGNRALPPSEQVRVTLLTPNAGERRDLFVFLPFQEGESETAHNLRIQIEACRRFVRKVECYEERNIAITNGDELVAFGGINFISELGAELLGELSLQEAEKKTSAARSASSQAETAASSGTAESVENRSSTSSADAHPEPAAAQPSGTS